MNRLAHNVHHVLVLGIAADLLIRTLTDKQGTSYWIAQIVLTIIILGSILASILHERQPRCMRCSLSASIDGKAKAKECAMSLWMFHRRWRILILLVALIVTPFLVSPTGLHDTLTGDIINEIPTIILVIYLRQGLVHKILCPWCPECRWRRPDDDNWPFDMIPLPTGRTTK